MSESTAPSSSQKIVHGSGEKFTSLPSMLVTYSILPFLDFDELLSLRLVNRLLKNATEKELFSRSTSDLSAASVRLCDPSFLVSMQIHEGWSTKHNSKAAVVQASLDKANQLGQATRGIVYEEGTAMQNLSAGKAVTMSDFVEQETRQDGGQFEDYETWEVFAPKFKKRIKGDAAWKLFKKFHFNMHLEVFPDVHAFSRIFFGLLVNASAIRWTRTVKSSWEMEDVYGEDEKSVLFIQLNDNSKIEIEMEMNSDGEIM